MISTRDTFVNIDASDDATMPDLTSLSTPGLSLLWISALLTSLFVTVTGLDCPDGCKCTEPTHNHFYVDCDDLDWTELPSDWPPHVTDLSMGGNRLSSLSGWEVSVFNRLKVLYLQKNNFGVIDNGTVEVIKQLDNLYALDLSHNSWDCSCTAAMLDLVTWLKDTLGPRLANDTRPWIALPNAHVTLCDSPSDLRGQRLDQLTPTQLCG